MSNISGLSKEESGFWNKWNNMKKPIFEPFVKICQILKIQPNWISYTAIVLSIVFYFLISKDILWATVILFAGLLLDGLDGPVARATGKAGPRGAITDVTADMLAITFTAMAWAKIGLVEYNLTVIYVLFYALILFSTFVRNAMDKPHGYMIIRPRLTTYILFLFFVIWNVNLLPVAFWMSVVYLGIVLVMNFVVIRREL
ncbi:MAG: CDP-alcohol phosphatidyltransferase family protein [bacterium]